MKRSLSLVFFAFVIAIGAMTSHAQAQATRTWVSGVGDDANPCSRTAPCKTWAGAISKTAAGGEMDALDPGGFGGLTITKAITIDGGGGGVESVLVSGTPGFTVAAGATDVVTIRNVAVNGIVQTGSGGTTGINFTSGGQLNIEHCVIQNFTNAGVQFNPTAKSFMNITDSTIEANQGGGVVLTPGSSGGRATISNTNILNNTAGTTGSGDGIVANANSRITIFNSTISNNQDGVFANGAAAFIFIFQSSIANNEANGVHASNSGQVSVSTTGISLNKGFGVLADTSGLVSSFGNNYITLNGSGSGTFNPPTITPMDARLRQP